jgi:hypothetical protein
VSPTSGFGRRFRSSPELGRLPTDQPATTPTIGYDTGIDYAAPRGTRRGRSSSFYLQHMRGWQRGEVDTATGSSTSRAGRRMSRSTPPRSACQAQTGNGSSACASITSAQYSRSAWSAVTIRLKTSRDERDAALVDAIAELREQRRQHRHGANDPGGVPSSGGLSAGVLAFVVRLVSC